MGDSISTKDVPGVVKVSAEALGQLPEPPKVGDRNIAPNTTAADDLVTSGQRRVNLIWEFTQATIAASVVGVSLYVICRLSFLALLPNASERQIGLANTAFTLLASLVSLVIGFYFGRTNHQRTGGVRSSEAGR